jgi:flagellar protein FliS
MNQNAAKHYREQQILNASPTERIVLCYNGAIKFLVQARQAIEAGNIQERFNNNKKACDLIMYLQDTLDMEQGGEIALNLQRLYGYMLRRLVDVDMNNSTDAIDDVVEKLRTLNVSWMKIANGDVVINPAKSGDVSDNEDSDERRPPINMPSSA